jgi:MFS family permease
VRDNKYNFVPYLIWLFPLAFFTIQFILRLWPSLMMQQLLQQYNINAATFGFLASVYYYGYAGMQIPIAIALDKLGAKKVLVSAAIVCALSNTAFSFSDNWYVALLCRFLIGASSAAGFLSTSKVITEYFPAKDYGKMVGFSFSIGLLGAIYGGKPTNLLIESYGYQNVALMISIIFLKIAALSFIFLNKKSKYLLSTDLPKSNIKFSDLKDAAFSKPIVLLAIANLLMVGSLEGFADVWGVNFLIAAQNFSKSEAAQIISMVFVGMLFGGPILAYFANKFGGYKVIFVSGFLSAAIFILLLQQSHANTLFLSTMLFLIGILCCYQVIVFDVGSKLVNPSHIGIAVAFLNSINMLGGSFFHTIIGSLMDLFWNGNYINNLKHYDVNCYKYSLLAIPICSIIGALMVLYVNNIRSTARSSLPEDIVA